jgi:Zn-dependent M28 family amino/carboxypeptidase
VALLAALCLLAFAAAAQEERIAVQVVPKETLEANLKLSPKRNGERAATLKRLFEEAGCADLVEHYPRTLPTPNVVCTLPGAEPSLVVVGAHHDKAPQGDGAIDNWSGASLLPSLFRALAGRQRRFTYVFVGFSAEETGLNGSREYLRQFKGDDIRRIKAMVNLDCLGSGQVNAWPNHSDKRLLNLLWSVSQSAGIELGLVNADRVGTSDAAWFRSSQIPTLDLHSLTQKTLPLLHSRRDTYEAVKLDDYEEAYRLVALFLAYLDAQRETAAEPSR